MPIYSYSPSKSVFTSEMKYTASQFTLIHCLEPDSVHQAITTPPSPPCAIVILGSFKNNNDGYISSRLIRQMLAIFFGVEF